MTTAMFLILIVEDDGGLRSILATLLEAHGYRSAEAEDGERAVIEARTRRPDLIIVDLGLPDRDGMSVIRADSQLLAGPDTGVVGPDDGDREDLGARCGGG